MSIDFYFRFSTIAEYEGDTDKQYDADTDLPVLFCDTGKLYVRFSDTLFNWSTISNPTHALCKNANGDMGWVPIDEFECPSA